MICAADRGVRSKELQQLEGPGMGDSLRAALCNQFAREVIDVLSPVPQKTGSGDALPNRFSVVLHFLVENPA